MKKLFLGLLSLFMVTTASAVDAIYVVGGDAGRPGTPPGTKIEAQNGYFTYTATTWSKISTSDASSWGDFEAACYSAAAGQTVQMKQDQTIKLTKANSNMPMPAYSTTFTYKIKQDLSEVEIHGAEAPASAYPALYLVGALPGANWSFSDTWKFQTEDGNLYYMEGKTLNANTEFKVAGNNYNPEYAGGVQCTVNNTSTLSSGANCKFVTGGSNLTISFNVSTKQILFSNTGQKVGDSTEKNPYEGWYVNCLFQNNSWADNGLNPDSDGNVEFIELPIGNGGFRIKTWNSADNDKFYGTGAAIAANTPVVLPNKANADDANMTVTGATPGSVYNVKYNVKTNTIQMIPTKVVYPDEMYVIGNVNGKDWAGNNGVKFTSAVDGVYTLDEVELGNAGTGYAYFSFTTALGNADYSGMGTRYAATSGDYEIELGTPAAISTENENNAFKIAGDTKYSMVVDLTKMTVTVNSLATPEPVYTYVLSGPIFSQGGTSMEMTLSDGIASATFAAQTQTFNVLKMNGEETVATYGPDGNGALTQYTTYQGKETTATWTLSADVVKTNGDMITLTFDPATLQLGVVEVPVEAPETLASAYVLINGNPTLLDDEGDQQFTLYNVKLEANSQIYFASPRGDSWTGVGNAYKFGAQEATTVELTEEYEFEYNSNYVWTVAEEGYYDIYFLYEDGVVVFEEGEAPVVPTKWTVYYTNPEGWATPYVWIWNETTKDNYTGGDQNWPGLPMTNVDGTWTFSYDGDIETLPSNVIFNDGKKDGAAQTANLVFEAGKTYTNGVPSADSYANWYVGVGGEFNGNTFSGQGAYESKPDEDGMVTIANIPVGQSGFQIKTYNPSATGEKDTYYNKCNDGALVAETWYTVYNEDGSVLTVAEATAQTVITVTFNCATNQVQIKATGLGGVEAIELEGAAARYFNLQGVEVTAPAAGNVYIKVANGKATKVLVK